SFHAAPVSPQGPVAAADAAATMEAPPGGHAGFDPSSRALGYDAPTQDESAVEEPPPPAAVEPEPEPEPEIPAAAEPEALSHEERELSRAEFIRALELDPKNDRARSRIKRLDTILSGEPGGGPVDLDALPDDRPAASVRVREDEPQSQDALIDLEEIIDEFKAGVSERISGEDHESHYDLGMAYMEMGLYDEAIGEFQVASKGAPMAVKCLEMIALCFLEKNEPASAARELSRALELPGYGPEETIRIRYNLAVANERLGDL